MTTAGDKPLSLSPAIAFTRGREAASSVKPCSHTVREVIRTAKDRHAGTQGYAEAVLLQYNKYAISKWVEDLKWLQSYTPQR